MALRLVILLLVLVCVIEVFGDGYGHGHSYMMPGGSRGRKWTIRARGKGMQNMMKIPSYHHKEEKKPEIHYYPVPVEHKEYKDDYKKDDYKSHYSHNSKMIIIPYHDHYPMHHHHYDEYH